MTRFGINFATLCVNSKSVWVIFKHTIVVFHLKNIGRKLITIREILDGPSQILKSKFFKYSNWLKTLSSRSKCLIKFRSIKFTL